jgi:hypothetical protein
MFTIAMERPSRHNEAVLNDALDSFMPEVLKYLQDESDQDGVRRDILKVVEFGETDGYELARDLERWHHWASDRELVDVMDGWSGHLYDAHKKAVEWWVRATGLKPACKVGDRIRAKHGGEVIEGPIHEVNERQAYYVVTLKGTPNQVGWHGAHVNYEDVLEDKDGQAD